MCGFFFFPLGTNGALASQLKKVGEVKVSSREDRKAGEIEMRQRTSRYCMNTSEGIKNNPKKKPQFICVL